LEIEKKVVSSQRNNQKHNDMGKIELMALPYELDALEPVISRETLGVAVG